MSAPVEIQNLIARVGYHQAKDILQNWLLHEQWNNGARQSTVLNPEETGPDAVVPTSSEMAAAGALLELSAGGGGSGAGAALSAGGGGSGAGAGLSAGGGGTGAGAALGATSSAAGAGEPYQPSVENCMLHAPQRTGMLCHTHNGRSYSTFSPPCNGCEDGQRERAQGIWMSGFGIENNVYYVPRSAIGGAPALAPTSSVPTLGATSSVPALGATSSAAALAPTPSYFS